jgi:hypothetical protein
MSVLLSVAANGGNDPRSSSVKVLGTTTCTVRAPTGVTLSCTVRAPTGITLFLLKFPSPTTRLNCEVIKVIVYALFQASAAK